MVKKYINGYLKVIYQHLNFDTTELNLVCLTNLDEKAMMLGENACFNYIQSGFKISPELIDIVRNYEENPQLLFMDDSTRYIETTLKEALNIKYYMRHLNKKVTSMIRDIDLIIQGGAINIKDLGYTIEICRIQEESALNLVRSDLTYFLKYGRFAPVLSQHTKNIVIVLLDFIIISQTKCDELH